jgi:metallophosphoesterase (TIGR03767 family)
MPGRPSERAAAAPDYVTRTDLGGRVDDDAVHGPTRGHTLVRLVHLSDLHVIDVASPARAEWVELLGDDPRWRPLLHMHRPYEALTHWALAAHVDAIHRDPTAPLTGDAYDLALSTGDNIDNAQRNELDAYLAIMAGGRAQLPATGGPQDPGGDVGSDAAATSEFIAPWPFWCPRPDVDDTWKPLGYPVVADYFERVDAPLTSPGIGIPWASLRGNHDVMRQGTSLTNPRLESIAVGSGKSLQRPLGFLPDDPGTMFVDAPERFSCGPMRPVTSDPDRRAIDLREWFDAHAAVRALGDDESHVRDTDAGCGDKVIDVGEVRIVVLDTNHPEGDYQGSVGTTQLAWLDERLAEVDAEPGRYAIIASHHGSASLDNDRGERPDRRLADALLDVVHRHPCAIAWLVGHRHVHRIEPRPGAAGGFWEIATGSIIDWPSQVRAIEIVEHVDGTVEIVTTLLDHGAPSGSLAALHRDVAHRFAGAAAAAMAGGPGDGNARLVLPVRTGAGTRSP